MCICLGVPPLYQIQLRSPCLHLKANINSPSHQSQIDCSPFKDRTLDIRLSPSFLTCQVVFSLFRPCPGYLMVKILWVQLPCSMWRIQTQRKLPSFPALRIFLSAHIFLSSLSFMSMSYVVDKSITAEHPQSVILYIEAICDLFNGTVCYKRKPFWYGVGSTIICVFNNNYLECR